MRKHCIHIFLALFAFPLWMQAQGNVGIGTVTPASKLHIIPDSAPAILIGKFGSSPGNTGELRFQESSGYDYVGFKAGDSIPASQVWTLPDSDGISGEVLSTDGNGNLFWSAGSGGSGGGGGMITAKPFINRRFTGSTSATGWTTLLTINPLFPGNYLTITNLQLEAYRSSCCCAYTRFKFFYSDGSSYTSSDYGCPGYSGYTMLADVGMPLFANAGGSITQILVEGYSDAGGTLNVRFSLSGFETAPAPNTIKPYINRRITGSTSAATWTTLATVNPLFTGNRLAITNLTLEAYRSSCCCAYVRFKVYYADGSTYTSSDYGCPGYSGYTVLSDVQMPVYANVRSTITQVDVEGYSDPGGTLNVRFTLSGYENTP